MISLYSMSKKEVRCACEKLSTPRLLKLFKKHRCYNRNRSYDWLIYPETYKKDFDKKVEIIKEILDSREHVARKAKKQQKPPRNKQARKAWEKKRKKRLF